MPRAAPAGAHPAARLNFFVDRGMAPRRENRTLSTRPGSKYVWRIGGLAKIRMGTTGIQDGLVFCYVEDDSGVGTRSAKVRRWRVVGCPPR